MATRSRAVAEATTNTVVPATAVPQSTGHARGRSMEAEDMLDRRGVLYEYYTEFDLELVDVERSLHNQARLAPLNRTQVESYKEAMQRGDVFPAVVLFPESNGKYLVVDGNHRVNAALGAHYKIGAYVIDARTRRDLITTLTYEANTKHGLPTSPEERANHAVWLIQNVQSTIKDAAARMNLPTQTVSRVLAQVRANDRAEALKVRSRDWEDLHISGRLRLNSIPSDEVFLAMIDFAVKMRLDAKELDERVVELRGIGSTTDQLTIIQRWENDNRDRIAAVATGEINPKRTHGWGGPRWTLRSSIYQVESLKDEIKRKQMVDAMNPVEVNEWVHRIDDAITVYQTIKKDLTKLAKDSGIEVAK